MVSAVSSTLIIRGNLKTSLPKVYSYSRVMHCNLDSSCQQKCFKIIKQSLNLVDKWVLKPIVSFHSCLVLGLLDHAISEICHVSWRFCCQGQHFWIFISPHAHCNLRPSSLLYLFSLPDSYFAITMSWSLTIYGSPFGNVSWFSIPSMDSPLMLEGRYT